MRRFVVNALLCVVLSDAACARQSEPEAQQRLSSGSVDLRYDAETLRSYGLQVSQVMEIVQRAVDFHRGVWPGPPRLAGHRVHVFDRWPEGAERLITVGPGCVTVLALENINRFAGQSRRPLNEAFEFAVAHELAHCFQRVAIPNHREIVFSPQSSWLLEGSASWLARKVVTKQYQGNPSFFWQEFEERHTRHLLTLANEALVFFSYLESSWGLDGTSAVMALLTDAGMPQPTCHATITPGPFPEAHSNRSDGDCPGEASPYRAFLESYLKKKDLSLKEAMSAYATALTRGEIRGAPSIEDFVRTVDIQAKPAPMPPDTPWVTPLVNGWLLAHAHLWVKGWQRIPIAEWPLIPESERIDPLGVLLVRFAIGEVEVAGSLGGVWYDIEALGDQATVDVTQTALDGEPGKGLSWQFRPQGGVIVDRDARPLVIVDGPSQDLQDLTDTTDDFTFAVTRTAIDDANSKARIRFFKVCPPRTACAVKD